MNRLPPLVSISLSSLLLAPLIASLVLAGCYVRTYPGPVVYSPPPPPPPQPVYASPAAPVYAEAPPPPAPVVEATIYPTTPPPDAIPEFQPGPPGYGYYWVAGYWDWTGFEWTWNSGYW